CYSRGSAAWINGDDSNDDPAFASKTDDRRAQFRHARNNRIGGCAAAAGTGGEETRREMGLPRCRQQSDKGQPTGFSDLMRADDPAIADVPYHG
ncbi:hypothetical protein RA267_28170, partial [Pseudomonas syringae pv. tagetis]|uniref:hypothetical protein n=1 Tax=Pseudomonas syringae group genomosp. 7 TaxID=251699 RepID=UPI00376FA7D4